MQWSIAKKVERKNEKARKLAQWNKFFAFIPIRIKTDVYWFEHLYRRKLKSYDDWEYRTLQDFLEYDSTNDRSKGSSIR